MSSARQGNRATARPGATGTFIRAFGKDVVQTGKSR
jgi:hypothetical protein